MGFNLKLAVCVLFQVVGKCLVSVYIKVYNIIARCRSIVPEKKLALYGQLEIDDLVQYLYKSKTLFYASLGRVYKTPGKLTDYNVIKFLAQGTYSKVYLVINEKTNEKHAMKILCKMTIDKVKQNNHVLNEQNISLRMNFPFLIYFEHIFIDKFYLYYLMPYITGGELFSHLMKLGKFEEEQSRFMCAQIVLGLEYLHYLNIIYRDLKPENIMIDHTGYLKISDFGFSKVLHDRTYTFCGTPEYIAPEVVKFQGYGLAVDWWAFGVLLYELNAGQPPFSSPDQMRIYEKAATLTYAMPEHFSQELRDLITNILQTNLSRRYGNLKNGVNDIKDHKWFQSIIWMALLNRKLRPSYIPDLNTQPEDNSSDYNIRIEDSDDDLHAANFKNF